MEIPIQGKTLFFLKMQCEKLIFSLTTVSQRKCISPAYVTTHLCGRQTDRPTMQTDGQPATLQVTDRQTTSQLEEQTYR